MICRPPTDRHDEAAEDLFRSPAAGRRARRSRRRDLGRKTGFARERAVADHATDAEIEVQDRRKTEIDADGAQLAIYEMPKGTR